MDWLKHAAICHGIKCVWHLKWVGYGQGSDAIYSYTTVAVLGRRSLVKMTLSPGNQQAREGHEAPWSADWQQVLPLLISGRTIATDILYLAQLIEQNVRQSSRVHLLIVGSMKTCLYSLM